MTAVKRAWTKSEFRALIFDLGKVVFDFSIEETFAQWAQSAGLDPQLLKERLVWNDIFAAYERGEVDFDHFYRAVLQQIEADIPRDLFHRAWSGMFRDEIPGIRPLLNRLKPHYRLVALSNTNAEHARVWRGVYPNVLSLFERIFASHEMGCRKPETEAFDTVLSYLGLKPFEALFIDDLEENIDKAREMGLMAILFRDATHLENELTDLGLRGFGSWTE